MSNSTKQSFDMIEKQTHKNTPRLRFPEFQGSWEDRTRKEEEVMKDLIPLLKRMTGGQNISGLSAYEE